MRFFLSQFTCNKSDLSVCVCARVSEGRWWLLPIAKVFSRNTAAAISGLVRKSVVKKEKKETHLGTRTWGEKRLFSPRLFNDKQQCSGTQWRLKVPATFKSRVIVDFVNQCPSVLLDVWLQWLSQQRQHKTTFRDDFFFCSRSLFLIRRRCQNQDAQKSAEMMLCTIRC